MRLCVLGSGSRGNSFYIEHNGTAVLIDVGFHASRIESLFKEIGADSRSLNGVLITHEHSDHVIGLPQFMKSSSVPVYMNEGTRGKLNGFVPVTNVRTFEQGREFAVGSIAVHPFPILHDAADPSGFRFEAGGRRLALATDIGYVTALVRVHIKGCHTLLLESNHDEELLLQGTYPWYLKQRILGKKGHLSNLHSARTIELVSTPDLDHVILVHLSQKNNTPELARKAHESFLEEREITLSIASQYTVGEVVDV